MSVAFLIEQQLVLFGFISRATDNLKKVGVANITLQRIEIRLKGINENWKKFKANHDRIGAGKFELEVVEQTNLEKTHYFTGNIYGACEESYLDAAESMQIMLDERKEKASSKNDIVSPDISTKASNSSIPSNIRLPRFDLPKFSGNYSDWVPFRDLFSSLVGTHPTLTGIEKLQYLKSSLTGNAALQIKNIAPVSSNFQLAWDTILGYYDNDRILVDASLTSLFSLIQVENESSSELENLYSAINQAIGSLEALKRPVDQWDDVLVFMITRKLDSISIKEWEKSIGTSSEPPTWELLKSFMLSRIRSLQAYERSVADNTPQKKSSNNPRNNNAKSHHVTAPQPSQTCSLCNSTHYVSTCPKYQAMAPDQRRELIVSRKLCFNCLGQHSLKNCRSQKRCQICNSQHHTSIHSSKRFDNSAVSTPPPQSTQPLQSPQPNVQPSTSSSVNVAQSVCSRSSVLLATAVVKVSANDGYYREARALIDQGSEISLISESLAQSLRLPRSRSSVPIVGIGAVSSRQCHGSVLLNLSSRIKLSLKIPVTAFVLPKITGYLPSSSLSNNHWPHLQGLELADPNFNMPGRIDLLLGADVYGHLLESGLRKGPIDAPIGQETSLGWILSGTAPVKNPSSSQVATTSQHCFADTKLQELLQKFWIQEEVFSTKEEEKSPEEADCEAHYASTHSRTFKHQAPELGDSRSSAFRQLRRLQNQFVQKPSLEEAYFQFMTEYEKLGHMELANSVPQSLNRVYYLPHHCVVRDTSSSTKYRVVFNGSMKTNCGISLNDFLHEGPKLLTDLADILTQWRQFEFAFSADVTKMFRQIRIHHDDWDYQRILWVDEFNAIIEYCLTTVTYGLTSAPYLANRTLKQLAIDEGHRFPLARIIVSEGTYIDDVFSGGSTIEEAHEKVNQTIGLFKAGGFPLRKWISNYDELLECIPDDAKEKSSSISIQDGPLHRTLGLLWQPATDRFVFLNPPNCEPTQHTKRNVLSRIAQLFDPLGLLVPIVVQAKIFMQELWLANLDWDEPLPHHLDTRWKNYLTHLDDLRLISIPRWIGIQPTALAIELHGFSDASQAALGAAVYIRVLLDFNEVKVTLVSAKSKVTPCKKTSTASKRSRTIRITTPRLELSAALLLARHIAHVQRVLKLEKSPVHLWTDSSNALYWIRSPPSRWKDFVRNRVSQIQEIMPEAHWHHVPGEDNSADLASRRTSPRKLAANLLWWHGPTWLHGHSANWPSVIPLIGSDVDLEERTHIVATTTTRAAKSFTWDLIDRYSSLNRLLRVTAWCQRVSRYRHHEKGTSNISQLTLFPEEIDAARNFWIKSTQNAYFPKEFEQLSIEKPLDKSSPIYRFAPFIDAQGLLRIGGRLRNAALDPDVIHPIILPRDCALTRLILDKVHKQTLHGGTQIMLATLRRNYWIIGGRNPVRSFIHRCVICARHRAVTSTQLMGQLPRYRTAPSRPFLHSGVDYAGPFTVKTWKGRSAKTYKTYLIVFVCFSSSAVHLELATDYSTEGFLAAFKRFTSRRGICSTLTSDCGTNLVGANAELRRLFTASSRDFQNFANLIANDGTKWSFNPPAAPHFGGKWEAAVKSAKFHIKRVIGEAVLTYEEFSTVLTQIEAVLNSRPICPLSNDPSDLEALTPGHFLIGSALNLIPEPSLEALPESRLSRRQLLRQMIERFWHRWSAEYIHRLQEISKWHRTSSNITVDSMVLIVDERYPPAKWPLARVISTHPGKDGLVRVVTLRTQNSTLTRPIVKLCLLPVASPSESANQDASFDDLPDSSRRAECSEKPNCAVTECAETAH